MDGTGYHHTEGNFKKIPNVPCSCSFVEYRPKMVMMVIDDKT
jgi:hypothetical protein